MGKVNNQDKPTKQSWVMGKSFYITYALGHGMKNVYANRRNSKGVLAALPSTALYVIVLVIIVAVGATLLTEVRSTQTTDAHDYNVTTTGLDALIQYSNWFEIIVIIIVMSVVIGLLLFSFLRGKGGM